MAYFSETRASSVPNEVKNEHDIYQNVPWNYFFEALIAFAEYQLNFADSPKGIAMLQYIFEHTYTEPRDRDQARELLDELQKKAPKAVFQEAVKQGQGLKLEQILQELKTLKLNP